MIDSPRSTSSSTVGRAGARNSVCQSTPNSACKLAFQPPAFARQQIVAIELLQGVPHPPQLGADRAPLGLAGMGRENQFDRQAVECLLHAPRPKSRPALKFGDRRPPAISESGLGSSSRLALAQHPHALPVFGDVGQVEKDAERPGDRAGLGVVEGGDSFGQLPFGLKRAAPPFAGQEPNLLDQFECGRAGQIAK